MDKQVSWWEPGDWNGFCGLGTNVLGNLLVLTGLLKFVIGIRASKDPPNMPLLFFFVF